MLLFKGKSECTTSSRESKCIYTVTNVCLSRQMLGMSQIPLLFLFCFFLSRRVSRGWSHSQRWLWDTEITSKLSWTFALCLYQVFCSTLLYTYFLSLEIPGTKIKQGVPFSLLRLLKLCRFLIADVLQLSSKYGFRGNSTSSLYKKSQKTLPRNHSLTWVSGVY